jgi:hypothetical protein
MPAMQSHPSPEELARAGNDILDRLVRPTLSPHDDGKFVAIDIDSAAFEIDPDDFAAVTRLRQRLPAAEVWLGRVGDLAAYRMRQRS